MTPSFTSLRGWLKPDEAISAGRYQIATRLSGARKDTWSVIAGSLATSDLPFLSLRGWLKPDEAISAGRHQIATHLSGARKDKKGRPRNDGGSGEKTELGPFLTAS